MWYLVNLEFKVHTCLLFFLLDHVIAAIPEITTEDVPVPHTDPGEGGGTAHVPLPLGGGPGVHVDVPAAPCGGGLGAPPTGGPVALPGEGLVPLSVDVPGHHLVDGHVPL